MKMLSTWGMILICVILILFIVILFQLVSKSKLQFKEGLDNPVKPPAAAGATAGATAGPSTQGAPFVSKKGPELYDDFYANIYDHLVFNNLRISYEVGEILNTTKPTSESKILDIGAGTGKHVKILTNMGLNATGLDLSPAMVKKAIKDFPETKMVEGDANDRGLFDPGSFTHIFCLYFSIYYFKNKTKFFKNCLYWLAPGGYLVIHVVNRELFDPILPPANPLFVVSPQKYAKERITQSKITFNNMDYVANFDLNTNLNVATFYEKFKDKETGNVRTNEHKFYMEPDKQILAEAKRAGFIIYGKIDLIKVGYEYQYLYILTKPM